MHAGCGYGIHNADLIIDLLADGDVGIKEIRKRAIELKDRREKSIHNFTATGPNTERCLDCGRSRRY